MNEYYTKMKGMWEEQDSSNLLPAITEMTIEVNAFVEALNLQKEELSLFQFLNGLDEDYTGHRSQLLMQSPLPTMQSVCVALQQEESQRDILNLSKLNLEPTAMYSKGGNNEGCSVCGLKGHTKDKCWHVIGFPTKKLKYKRQQRMQGKGGEGYGGVKKWNANRGQGQRMAAVVHGQEDDGGQLTSQQIEQLLKLLQSASKTIKSGSETEEELDGTFAGMVT